jgi:hypothetical protein
VICRVSSPITDPSLLLFILVGTVLLVDGSAYPDCGLPRRSPPVVEVLASEHA